MSISWLSYLATTLVLTGVYYVSIPLTRGQYFILAADLCWFTYAACTKQWGLMAQSTVLTYINFTAIRNWTKKGMPL